MNTSSKLRKLQRQRKLRRQRRTFLLIIITVFMLMAHSAFSQNRNSDGTSNVTEIRVLPGETLWEIALEFKPENSDVREFMYEIAAINGVKDGNIVSGQKLIIPVAQ